LLRLTTTSLSSPAGRVEPVVTTDRGIPDAALRRVTAVLCATEVISWGVLYYAFPVLSPSISDDTGWSQPAVVAAFTSAQLTAAGTGLLVGRRIHRRGPRAVMTVGSLLAVGSVLAVARAGTWWQFLAAWCVTGAAMAATLYPPAFAALTTWGGRRRLQALTALTLVGGLASTVFAPLAAVLDDRVGWRDTYTVLAGILAVTVALHAWGLRAPWPAPEASEPPTVIAPGVARSPWALPGFTRTVVAFGLAGVCMWSVLIVFVPLLTARGFSAAAAATALGLGGVGQVCGRLGYGRLDAATSASTRTRLVFTAVGATTLALAVTPGPYVALVALSFLAGTVRGIFTLLQATAVTDRWGSDDYARLNATLSLPLMAAAAFAPWFATAVATSLDSHAATLAVFAALAGCAALVVPRSGRGPTGP
jgi:MFS family permease